MHSTRSAITSVFDFVIGGIQVSSLQGKPQFYLSGSRAKQRMRTWAFSACWSSVNHDSLFRADWNKSKDLNAAKSDSGRRKSDLRENELNQEPQTNK